MNYESGIMNHAKETMSMILNSYFMIHAKALYNVL